MNTARLAVTAAFARGMPNFTTDPPVEPCAGAVAVYPWGRRSPVASHGRRPGGGPPRDGSARCNEAHEHAHEQVG